MRIKSVGDILMENEKEKRQSELFSVLSKSIKQAIGKEAKRMSVDDDEAISEGEKISKYNKDVGGGWNYEELPEYVTDRLEDEAGEDLIQQLSDVFEDGSDTLQILTKIIRGQI